MDFLIKLGETGFSFVIPSVPSTEKVAFLMDKIRAEAKIEPKEQILLTKKGYKLKPEDVLSVIENENIFQTTLHSELSSRLKQTHVIYVFNAEKVLNSAQEGSLREVNKENLIKEFLETVEEPENILITAKVIDKDFPRSFLVDFPGADQEKFGNINGEIFRIEETLFKQYQSIRRKYLEYTQRVKRLDKAINECENQMQSFDVILKETSQCYQVVKVKKNDIQKRMKENQEKNSFTVKKFEESIDNLRKIELHEQLKTEKVSVLLDVYYDPEAMVQWKNNCLSSQNALKAKTDKIANYLKSMKKKIKDERNSNIASGINLYKVQKEKFESLFHETETIVLSIFTEVYDEYKTLRKNMEVFHNDSNNENALFFLSNLETVSGKIGHYNDQIISSTENNEKLTRLFENVTKTKVNLETLIIQEYRIMHKFIFELTSFSQEKIKLLNDEIDKMEKEFSYLLSPLSLPKAYQDSLSEISRRRDFYSFFETKLAKLQKAIDLEKDRRKKFLSINGKILPSEFIPQLKSMPPGITVSNLADGALPKIDGYHNEADSYHNKSI